MSFTVSNEPSQSGTTYEPIPADNHIGVCVGVIELGTHMESYEGKPPKPTRKLKLQFELPGVSRDDNKAGLITASYNLSLHEKATFRKTLDGWLGADWTTRFNGQSLAFLLGMPAFVNVVHEADKKDSKKTWARIATITKFPRGMPVPAAQRDTVFFDIDTKVLPEYLSPYDADKIRTSQEYLAGGFTDMAPTPKSSESQPKTSTPPRPPGPSSVAPPRPQAPAEVAALLPRYGLAWPYTDDDLTGISIPTTPEDLTILQAHSNPF